MSTTGLRRCCHCGTWFKPHPRNAYHQRFCSVPACQAASKQKSQRKWARKNPSYFRGEHQVERVRAWRRQHPGYWRRRGAGEGPENGGALQDVLKLQPAEDQAVKAFRDRLSEEISRPLQDVLTAQSHALVGLASLITGDALQEEIAEVLTACYERGQRIGGMAPWMTRQEVRDERTSTDRPAEAPPRPGAVQLGRSPSGP